MLFLFSFAWAGEVDPKKKDQNLSGAWFDKPYVAEQNCYGLLLLFADHKFAMRECLEDRTLRQITDAIGEWTLNELGTDYENMKVFQSKIFGIRTFRRG